MGRREYHTTQEIPTGRWIAHPYKPGVVLPVHRRPMRLASVDYTSPACVCFVTYCLAERDDVLVDVVGETAWAAIFDQKTKTGFQLDAACLMPDHVHVLIAPGGNGESVSDIVRGLKLAQTHTVKSRFGVWLRWQPSFYDHVLGRTSALEEERTAIRAYIQQNPVRADLARTPFDYPFVYPLPTCRAGATPPAGNTPPAG